jgi:hypothetical protein
MWSALQLIGVIQALHWLQITHMACCCFDFTLQMVLPEALQSASAEAVAAMAAAGQGKQQQQDPVVSIADKFRQAYIDRARRLKEKERRLAAAQERKQLKASHALRTLDAWLDERE